MDTPNKPTPCPNETKCDTFKSILGCFEWFYLEGKDNEPGTLVMPYVEDYDGNKKRVNFCPVCGKNIRGVNIRDNC